MSVYSEINRNPSPRELLSFGLIFLGGTGGLGLLEWFVPHRYGLAQALWGAGIAVFLLSVLVRPVARVLYVLWMGLGISMGLVTSPIILVVAFLLLITPVALFFRLVRRDALKRTVDKGLGTYWETYPESDNPATYLKQY